MAVFIASPDTGWAFGFSWIRDALADLTGLVTWFIFGRICASLAWA